MSKNGNPPLFRNPHLAHLDRLGFFSALATPSTVAICGFAAAAETAAQHGSEALVGVCPTQASAEKWAQAESDYTIDWDLGKNQRAKERLMDEEGCSFEKGVAHAGRKIVARRKSNFGEEEFVVLAYGAKTFVVAVERWSSDYARLVSVCADEGAAEDTAMEYALRRYPTESGPDVTKVSRGKCKKLDPSVFGDQYKAIQRSWQSTPCGSFYVGEMMFKGKKVFAIIGSTFSNSKSC